jgi:hypothetical protein
MSELSGALCVGQHALFESTDVRDHLEARALCDACPALEACTELLREVQTVSRTLRDAGGGAVGTWAGELVGASPASRRGRRNPREHGTERGYQQHRWNHEERCEPCRAAHRVSIRQWEKAQVRGANRTPVRGTIGAVSGPESASTDRGLATVSTRPKGA